MEKLPTCVLALLRSSWRDIDYNYAHLTKEEQRCITPAQFTQICGQIVDTVGAGELTRHPPKLTPLDAFHTECHMTRADYEGCVISNAFIDYDGSGSLATATHVSDITIYPSITKDFVWPEWATHVCWYNK